VHQVPRPTAATELLHLGDHVALALLEAEFG